MEEGNCWETETPAWLEPAGWWSRFLEYHLVTSHQPNRGSHTTWRLPPPILLLKTLSWKPLRSSERELPILLAWLFNKPFLLQTPMLWFVWPNYVLGTQTWVQQHRHKTVSSPRYTRWLCTAHTQVFATQLSTVIETWSSNTSRIDKEQPILRLKSNPSDNWSTISPHFMKWNNHRQIVN